MSGDWWVLTGCRKGAVPTALVEHGPGAAERELQRLIDAFGRDRVVVELWDHGDPLDSARNDALAEIAARAVIMCVATNNVHYATPARRPLATALAAVRARRSLDEIDPWLPAGAGAHLRSGAEQVRRFARYPGVVEAAAELGHACAFDLALVAPDLPPFPCPPRHDEMSCAARAHVARRGASVWPTWHRAGARRVRAARARARGDREARLPRLLPDRVGSRGVLPASRHLLSGAGLGRELGRLLRARHHERRRGVARPAVRAVLVP